ncbi:MAG: CehA/McbA family metallohydrolase [Oscillospiraceae bacterium]|nr:CehA/McbA family metallohydrolase [Oscillospiraceae bacterium]
MAAENSSMTMDAVNDTWEIIPLGEGLYNVKNVGRGSYMEWYNKFGNWSTYNSKYAATDDQFQLAFAPVAKDRYAKLDNELVDGDQVLIYYNADSVVVTDVALDEKAKKLCTAEAYPTADDFIKVDEYTTVFDVSIDENGYVTFTSGGKYLTSGETGNKLYMADAPSDYSLWVIKPVEGGVHVVNANAAFSGKAQALEYYGGFTTYSEKDTEIYLFNLYTLTDEQPAPFGSLIEGSEVVIYNISSEGVLAKQNDQMSIENVPAYLTEEMKAVPENGAVIFKVIKNGEWFRFYNETYGYLCSNGTGNNAFYSKEATDDADWKATEGKKGGYNLESRTAKFNGKYSQYLEYYADSYKTYSMNKVTDWDIYEFFFYPVGTDFVNVTNGIVNNPQFVLDVGNAHLGQDWVVTFTVDAVFGIEGEIEVKIQGDPAGDGSEGFKDIPDAAVLSGPDGEGKYTVTVSAENVAKAGKGIAIDINATDKTGYEFGNWTSVEVIDEPSIGKVSPAVNSETGDDKRPVISAEIINAGEDATVILSVNAEAVEAVYADGKVTYTPSEDLPDGRTSVLVSVKRADGLVAEKAWSFTVGEAQYQLYFGQLHSHTTYSDGSGSLESALDYVAGLPESANVDFVAFTDHSNYFDTTSDANPEEALYDMSLASAESQNMWNEYKSAIASFNNSQTDVVAIGGFEMTWSGGPGHINTFNTPGIVSRNNSTLNNKTSDAGMKAYYALLSQAEGVDSLSQFNHPGSTFGTFTDFAYWDAVVDTRIQMVEVGNGEGQIGAGGYYPSYEYYVMALDKGWHVAPTNNQDNHKGKWGNGNDARDVVLTDNFTEEGIYQAIRDMRMYATEDKNLEIGYTVNGKLLGSTIEEVPEKLNINVTVYDPDASDSISKVEVVVNSGKTAYTWDDPAVLAAGELTAEIDPAYSYYFIRVTEGDGDLAVTAPVWVGESLKLGISSFVSGTSTPVTGEELTLTTTLFNSEKSEATVKALTYSIKGGEVIGTDTKGYTVPASGTCAVEFKWTPETAKVTTVTVTAVVELDGEEYTFTMDVELDVQDSEKLVYIGIDASHYNEYVNGNYKDSMGNFGQLAAGYGVRTVTLYESEDLIAACSNPKYKALILTAPSRRLEAAQNDPKVYSEAELEAIAAFNKAGGIVIIAGWSDNYENYDIIQNNPEIKHMAETQNDILKALGSSIRMGDDATYDDVRSAADGVDKWRLYFNTYGDSFLTEGVEVDPENPYDRLYTEVFSHYGGATIFTADGTLPETVTPIVFGHATTYSVDVDKDGLGGNETPKYEYAEGDNRLMVMAAEQLEGQGLIIVSGAAFMSNFEVQATIEDSGSEKNYSNYKICENLLAYINPVTISDIADVQAEKDEGVKFTVEGIVTSNASGYDKDTAFFDCIYVQDETAGINAFPVAGNFKIGDKVRISGTTSSYNGERQLNVSSIEKVGEETPVTPKEVSAKDVNDGSVLGSLITIKGVVESYAKENGLVQTIMVKDAKGETARVFIDGYITTDKDVQNLRVGSEVVVTGLASYDNSFDGIAPRIRIRDRADVAVTGYSGGIGGEGENVSNIIINMNGKTEGEANPETGAPVYSAFSGIAVLAAAAFVLGKRR